MIQKIAEKNIVIYLLLILIAYFLYWPTIHGGAFWDDYVLLFLPYLDHIKNPFIFWVPKSGYLKTWPVFYSFIWILKLMVGKNYVVFHCTSIFLHATNSFLLFLAIKKYLKRDAELIALLFLTHPIHLLTVSWIIQIKTLLLIFFTLIAILNYKNWKVFAGFIFLAIGSKLIAFTVIPFVYANKIKLTLKNKFLVIIVSLGVLVSGYILYQFKPKELSFLDFYSVNFLDGQFVSLLNFLRYVKALFIPMPVSLFQENTPFIPTPLGFLWIFSGFTALGLFTYKYWHDELIKKSLIFFFINIFPLCGIIYLPIFYYTNFADYWLSFPLLSICLIFWKFLENHYFKKAVYVFILINAFWVYREAGKLTNIEAFFEKSTFQDKSYGAEYKIASLAQHFTYVGKCEKAEATFKKIEHIPQIEIYCIPSKIDACYKNRWRIQNEVNKSK